MTPASVPRAVATAGAMPDPRHRLVSLAGCHSGRCSCMGVSRAGEAHAYTTVATDCMTPATPYACRRVDRTVGGALYFVVITRDNPRPGQRHLRGVVYVTKLRRIGSGECSEPTARTYGSPPNRVGAQLSERESGPIRGSAGTGVVGR